RRRRDGHDQFREPHLSSESLSAELLFPGHLEGAPEPDSDTRASLRELRPTRKQRIQIPCLRRLRSGSVPGTEQGEPRQQQLWTGGGVRVDSLAQVRLLPYAVRR